MSESVCEGLSEWENEGSTQKHLDQHNTNLDQHQNAVGSHRKTTFCFNGPVRTIGVSNGWMDEKKHSRSLQSFSACQCQGTLEPKRMPFQKAPLAVGINSKCGKMSSLGKRSYWNAVEKCVPAPTSKTCVCSPSGAGGQCGQTRLFVRTVSSTEFRARSSHIMLP